MKNSLSLFLFATIALMTNAFAIRAEPKPLDERVREAKTIFVGKLVNKKVDGDWVRAELIVEESLKNANDRDKIEVIWRAKIGGQPIYDTDEGSQGIAILGDKHEGRYWLRDDKFEDLKLLGQVKILIKLK